MPHLAGLAPRLRLVTADDAVFAPVRTGNAFEEAVERILRVIKLGLVPPGERLPAERELAERLNVSRMTLREAIRSLQEAGYVETRRGRSGGTFVVAPPPRSPHPCTPGVAEDLADALCFRAVVEPGATELAAARPHDAAAVQHLGSRLREVEGASLPSYRQADSRLHLAIAELAGSPSLLAAVADVRVRINDLLDAIPLLSHNLAHSNRQHQRIVRAVLAGDRSTARRVMDEHLAASAALLRGFLG